jgi:hypothetical protein
VDYWLDHAPTQPVIIEFQDAAGKTIKAFSSASQAQPAVAARGGRLSAAGSSVTAQAGMNRFLWDMRYPDSRGIEGGTFFLGGSLRGPQVIPGRYRVKLTAGTQSITEGLNIKKDPGVVASEEDYAKQIELLLALRDKLSDADDAVNRIHLLQRQIKTAAEKAGTNRRLTDAEQTLNDALNGVISKLYEPRFTGFDDQTLIYPLKLNNRLAALASSVQGDYRPTQQEVDVFAELSKELDDALLSLKRILGTDLPAFNNQLKASGLPEIDSGPQASPN